MQHASVTASQSGLSAAALLGESEKPANCFKMNGTGKIEEGIMLELNHPLASGAPALFVGQRYILQNRQNACIFERAAEGGRVRRAIIEWKKPASKKPFPLLTQPNGGNPPFLLQVIPHLSVPENVQATMKIRFAYDVITDAEIIEMDHRNQETLIALREGQHVDVFYVDGSVKRAVCTGDTVVINPLTIDEQAAARIQRAKRYIAVMNGQIEASFDTERERCARQRDATLHELISVMEVGGKRSPDVIDKVLQVLAEYGREGVLRAESVRSRSVGVLRKLDASRVMAFEEACLPSAYVRQVTIDSGLLDLNTVRKGTPADRKAKLAARSLRDKEARAAMKGKHQEVPAHAGNKKKR
ncbi:MAG: hypothetical protein AAB582_01650 [Patescibacteria group bacterium]